MNEVVVINSFRNHDLSLYPIKNQKSIAGNWTEKTVVRHFNREFFLLSPIILLCYFPKNLNITIFRPLNIIYNSKFYLCGRESDQKKFNSMRCGADSCRFYQCVFLKCDRCVSAGEPAAVGESLEERSLVIGHWSLVGGFEAIILNGCVIAWLLGNFLIVNCQLECLEVRSLVIGHWSLAEFGEERSLVISERG
jgi:hypothetical protein